MPLTLSPLQSMIQRLRHAATSSLHRRLGMMFAVLVTIPAVLLAGFAALVLHYGVQVMFADQVKTAVNNAEAVATAYLAEHQQTIKADVLAAAGDLDRQAALILANPSDLGRFLDTQNFLRNFSETVLFEQDGRIMAEGGMGAIFRLDDIPLAAKNSADAGDVAVFTQGDDAQRIHALVRLNNFPGTYLYASRLVDAQVLSYVEETRDAATMFQTLDERRAGAVQKFMALFLVVCVLVMAAAIAAGYYMASNLSRPIEQLVRAADQVRAGNLAVQVPEDAPGGEDFAALNRTFNRMTAELATQRRELQAAERQAAWADVARRVAHEIKNPLTPVQLSAERLRRRFLKNIPVEDQDVYTQCIDTIIRHVGDIGRMAGEFASFARMPAPVLGPVDVGDLIRDVAALHQSPTVRVETHGALAEPDPSPALLDAGQMRQALTNLLLNAVQSIEQTGRADGRIILHMSATDSHYMVVVMDNGMGFPANVALERLGEPYVTYKEKGTGLGLAVVKKIMDDHGGMVKLGGMDDLREMYGLNQGATVTLMIPRPLAKDTTIKDNQSHAA